MSFHSSNDTVQRDIIFDYRPFCIYFWMGFEFIFGKEELHPGRFKGLLIRMNRHQIFIGVYDRLEWCKNFSNRIIYGIVHNDRTREQW